MSVAPTSTREPGGERVAVTDYVTVFVDGQLFGLPIASVQDVFMRGQMTPVPGAPPEILGLINLRGRVLTALSLRRLLGLADPLAQGAMVVGVEHGGESFGLLVDRVGEVLSLPVSDRRANPGNLDPAWARFARGIYWLPEGLLVVLDIDAALGLGGAPAEPDGAI
ncbi:chemotaxis protein CheW [Alsobacter sp. SYSU M60028]|uniref:Chemotaxis protein CheW n=1 Tax=Alsobacter ponti TaxID=2962936 RepID=A0ABT1LHE6_9HYPH|nr:chemotaxis protein CheW [Alsobacter ponti]MCP8940932.1 chemotaxis protein CheW [Alsobacter ponti]